jgi:hypothetical protein
MIAEVLVMLLAVTAEITGAATAVVAKVKFPDVAVLAPELVETTS